MPSIPPPTILNSISLASEIGDGAVLGLGAFVVNDVPAGAVMVCVAAREL